jgi:protocatechuate 3,4-dioxygenase beta subunit
MAMRRVALATVILGAIALTARAQPPRVNPSISSVPPITLSGRVVADDTGEALANARVGLGGSTQSAVLTDHDGRFALSAPAGRNTIAVSKTGYGRREITASSQPIEIRLQRGVAISGRVTDAQGDPVVGARVVAEMASKPATGTVVAADAFTNDRGEYRMGSLAPDTFKIAVMTQGEPTRQELPGGNVAVFSSVRKTYYSDAATADAAQAVRLEPGEDSPSIDFVVPVTSVLQQMVMMMPLGFTPAPNAAARPTGVIRGRVVTTDGRAVSRAQVRLMPALPPSRGSGPAAPPRPFQPTVVPADDEGRFEFVELAAGSFRIAAVKAGYSPPGETMSPGPPPLMSGLAVDLGDGETREHADITLARWGTLTGRVFDELGEPLQGVSVQLLQVRYQGGRRRLVAAGGSSPRTDDLGRFRSFGLAPGRYIVSAAVGDVASADLPGYTRSYYPGTPNASEAQFVSVALSQEVAGIDFSLAREKTALISGTLLDATGTPSTRGSVRLMTSQRSASAISTSIGARLLSDGRFEFPNVTPGQYVIQVDRGRRGSAIEGEFGAMPVSVNGVDVTNLVLQTSAGSSIAGRVTFDSYLGANAPRPGAIEITTVPIDPDQSTMSPASADIRDDWSFSIAGVNGPRRLQLQRAPAEWTLKEIRVRGIDVTDRPLAFGRDDQSLTDVEIVLSDRVNEISGAVVDDRGRPAPGSHAVVFATDRDRWYPASRFIRQTAAGADGAIALAGLPAGSYYAAAVARLPADGDDAWQDPAFLESLVPRARDFAIGEGQKQVLNLKLP